MLTKLVLSGLLYYRSVAGMILITCHFAMGEQMLSPSYADLRIPDPHRIPTASVLHSCPPALFSFFLFQFFIDFQRIHRFWFILFPIIYFQGKGAQQESHSCNFRLCKKFVIASDFCNKILSCLQLKIRTNTCVFQREYHLLLIFSNTNLSCTGPVILKLQLGGCCSTSGRILKKEMYRRHGFFLLFN